MAAMTLARPLTADAPASPWRTVCRYTFAAATVYNLVWGVAVILFPQTGLDAVGVHTDAIGLQFWQCIGMFVLVFAIGYAYAAVDPERYAPFILTAALGKLFGPVGFAYGYLTGKLPGSLGWALVFNDLIWWPVFFPFVWQTMIRPRLAGRDPVA